MNKTFASVRGGRLCVVAIAAFMCLALVAQPAWAALDYSASLAADFQATYPGGDPTPGHLPTANPFGANTEWELHGRNGLASDLTTSGGTPAAGQPGWCEGSAGVCGGTPPYSYFGNSFWAAAPGITIHPGVVGHAPQEILWTAPASVDEGGISISGSIEELFGTVVLHFQVFKNNSAIPSFFVDAAPPFVDGVLLNRVDFGPAIVPVVPGDKLRFKVVGSGPTGEDAATFSVWDVSLAEVRTIPEPASVALLVLGGLCVGVARLRKR